MNAETKEQTQDVYYRIDAHHEDTAMKSIHELLHQTFFSKADTEDALAILHLTQAEARELFDYLKSIDETRADVVSREDIDEVLLTQYGMTLP